MRLNIKFERIELSRVFPNKLINIAETIYVKGPL